jgi:hypothetical protein
MEAKELRIGNWVQPIEPLADAFNGYRQVTTVYENRGTVEYHYPLAWFEPIPLTEELLLKCGFVKDNIGGYWIELPSLKQQFKTLTIAWCNDSPDHKWYAFFRDGKRDDDRNNDAVVCLMRNMNYLHQLQNLYFTLTGQELNIEL